MTNIPSPFSGQINAEQTLMSEMRVALMKYLQNPSVDTTAYANDGKKYDRRFILNNLINDNLQFLLVPIVTYQNGGVVLLPYHHTISDREDLVWVLESIIEHMQE